MLSYSLLGLAAGGAFVLAAAPVPASALPEPPQSAPCFTCNTEHRPEPIAKQAADSMWRIAALSKAPRRYTRFDVEGLRLLTRMR